MIEPGLKQPRFHFIDFKPYNQVIIIILINFIYLQQETWYVTETLDKSNTLNVPVIQSKEILFDALIIVFFFIILRALVSIHGYVESFSDK